MEALVFSATSVQFFLLVFVRVLSTIAVMPFFGAAPIPVQIKVGLSFALAIIVFPLVPIDKTALATLHTVLFVVLVLKEIVIGLIVGFVSSLVFYALQFALYLISNEMGFSFVDTVDPMTESETTPFGQLMIMAFTVVFLCIGGHYFLIMALRRSFEIIPLLGGKIPAGAVTWQFTKMITDIFIVGIKLAAPVVVTLFLTTIGLGVVSRTVPQMNVFFVGVPLKIVLGIYLTIFTLPTTAALFSRSLNGFFNDVWKLMLLLAGG
jgi:flagellar biosynthetic protein FliR